MHVDSAADVSIVPDTLVRDLGTGIIDRGIESVITYGNGAKERTSRVTRIGPIESIVADVIDPLLSSNDVVDSNHSILMNKIGGIIQSDSDGTIIPIVRHNKQWLVDAREIMKLGSNPSARHDDSDEMNFEDDNNGIVSILSARVTRTSSIIHKEVVRLHERAGHASVLAMIRAIRSKAWIGCGVDVADVKHVMARYTCVACALSKRNALPRQREPSERKVAIGEIISADPVGKINPESANGDVWFILFKDICTGFEYVVTSKTKSAKAFVDALDEVVRFFAFHNHTVKTLRTDSENTFDVSEELISYLERNRILSERSAPFAHHQNSVERDVQTVIKGVAAMMHGQLWLRASYWHYALRHYVKLRNRMINVHHKHKTPHQRVTGERTDFSNTFMFAFGDLVSVTLPKPEKSWKFDVKRDIGIIVGQPDSSVLSHLVYNPNDHSVKERTDAILLDITEDQMASWLGLRDKMRLGTTPYSYVRDAILDFTKVAEEQNAASEGESVVLRAPIFDDDDDNDNRDADVQEGEKQTHAVNIEKPKKHRIDYTRGVPGIDFQNHRSTRNTSRDVKANYVDVKNIFDNIMTGNNVFRAFKARVRTDDTPTVRNALKPDRSDRDKWLVAIEKEIQMLFDQGTLERVKVRDVSRKSRVIRMIMQLKIKRNQDGSISKYKARGCADGSLLSNEYFESFSPTVASPALFLVLQTAIIDQMHMCTIDVVGAYLYQSYPDDALLLYITLPEEISNACNLNPNQLYRIRKYLYGLPDAGKAFYEAYAAQLESHNYIRSRSDPCLFVKFGNNGRRTYICIHVDDTFVCSTHKDELERLQMVLKEVFEITVTPEVDSYLGIQLEKLSDGSVKLCQPKLLDQLLSEYNDRLTGRTPDSPMRNEPLPSHSPSMDRNSYLHLLGGLMYMLKSRPDIGAALSYAATHSVSPTEAAFERLLHCLHYLKGTRDLGLVLMTGVPHQELTLTCYVDASYLSHADSKSHHGWCMSLGQYSCFMAKSQKQTIVATSSTHAEMRALFQLAMDIVYTIELMREIGRPLRLPAIIMEDNQPVIDLLAEAHGRTKKSKHFLMNIAYVRDLIRQRLLVVRKVDAETNTSDILTKAVVGKDFRFKRQRLLGTSPGEVLEEPVGRKGRGTL